VPLVFFFDVLYAIVVAISGILSFAVADPERQWEGDRDGCQPRVEGTAARAARVLTSNTIASSVLASRPNGTSATLRDGLGLCRLPSAPYSPPLSAPLPPRLMRPPPVGARRECHELSHNTQTCTNRHSSSL
jgi:hypothetical protein